MSFTDKPANIYSRREVLQTVGMAAAASVLPHQDMKAATSSAALNRNASHDDLVHVFSNPPPEAKPALYWYWMNGIVTQEGVAADLEAMARAGFGRAILFTIGLGNQPSDMKPYRSLTPEWWNLLAFAIAEAGRVGVEITMGACDGWATAAGPWIEPETSMQKVVFSQIWLNPGETFSGILPEPMETMNYYRDIKTIAFPVPSTWSTSVARKPTVTSSFEVAEMSSLNSHKGDGNLDSGSTGWIQYSFDQPFTVRGVIADGADGGAGTYLSLEASDDGTTFRRIGNLARASGEDLGGLLGGIGSSSKQTDPAYFISDVPQTTAKFFRIVFDPTRAGAQPRGFGGPGGGPTTPPPLPRLKLTRLVLLDEPAIPQFDARSIRVWSLPLPQLTDADIPRESCVPATSIVDITTHVGPDGALTWTPPGSGVWKIVRIGHTSTGSFNVTGHPAGRGLECDKLSAKAAQIQFNGWLGELSRRLGKTSASKALSTMHVDSWECGTQNWSRDFPEEFRKRRGYNILDYLPVMAGVPVERAETCDRVLTDVRRTIAGATQDNFYGEMARLSRLAGFDFSAESANPIYPVDPLAMAKYVDCPMGEFWTKGDDKPSDVAEAIHGGHIYGRRVIGGEAFTEFAMDWNETPFSCKVLGDANWAKGINKLTCHVWASQPWVDAAHEPGMTLEDIGVFFSRTNVWYDMAKPWVTYMSRTQALLQQGRPIIDVACYLGENIPVRAYVPSDTSLPIPEGYNFDSINTDALMNPVQIEGGAIVLPSGQRYAVLLMPRSYGITPQVLNRIDELVRLGATVVGLPPNGPIGLEGGPEAAAEIAKLSTSLWGTETGLKRHGNGWIGRTEDLKSLLLDRIAGPDCLIEAPAPSPGWASPFMWTHRQGLDWDLYFISNQTNAAQEVRVQFRVVNRTATLWDADSGEMKLLQQQPVAGGTEVTIPFDPCGAAIVIFRKNADATRSNFSPNGSEVAVSGPWKVTFQRTRPTPKTVELRSLESWSKSSDPDIRYYSGIAIYETRFTLSESASAGWQLDLGEVADLCEVELNGRVLRQMWKPPFQVNLSDAARPGENRLVVRVVNTWRNRLVGDADLPAHERQSFTVTPFFSKAHRSENGPSGSRAITTTNSNGIFLGGGFGNDSLAVPLRGSPAGTPPPTLKGISRYGFPGGGSSAPGPDVRRLPDEDGLLISGFLGPVRLIGMSAD